MADIISNYPKECRNENTDFPLLPYVSDTRLFVMARKLDQEFGQIPCILCKEVFLPYPIAYHFYVIIHTVSYTHVATPT